MPKKHEKARAVAKAGTTSISNPTALSLVSIWGYLVGIAKSKVALIEGTCQHFPYQWAMLTGSSSSRAGKLFATITREPQVLITLFLDPTVWSRATTSQFAAANDCFEQFLRYTAKLCPGGWFAWAADVSSKGLSYHLVGSLGRVNGDLKIEDLTRRWLALSGSKNPQMLRAKAAPEHAWRFMKKRIKAVSKKKRLAAPANTLYGISRPRNAGVPQAPTTYPVTPQTIRRIHRMLEREVYASNVKGFRKHIRHERYSFTKCGPAVVKKIIRIAKNGMK